MARTIDVAVYSDPDDPRAVLIERRGRTRYASPVFRAETAEAARRVALRALPAFVAPGSGWPERRKLGPSEQV